MRTKPIETVAADEAHLSKAQRRQSLHELRLSLIDQIDRKDKDKSRCIGRAQQQRLAVNLCRVMIQAGTPAADLSRFMHFGSNVVWTWVNLKGGVSRTSVAQVADELGVEPNELTDEVWSFTRAEKVFSKELERREAELAEAEAITAARAGKAVC